QYDSYHPWAFFKKRSSVPGNVVVCMDLIDMIADNDDRFGILTDLTTANTGSGRPYPRAGRPHNNKANVLFHDGSVRLLKAFVPINGDIAPATFDARTTQLADWMIVYPRPGDSAQNLTYNRWKRGREIPNF